MSITETDDEAAPTESRETLYITDAELIRRLGVPEKIARLAIKELDRQRTGFPQKSPLWGGKRRYWPAVKAWLDRDNGLKSEAPVPMRRVS